MKFAVRAATLLLPILLTTSVLAQPPILERAVDCAAGEELGKVLRELKLEAQRLDPALVRVEVSGECVVNLVVDFDNLWLRGPDGGQAVLRGSPELSGTPVLEARGVQGLFLQNLTVTGSRFGLRLVHSRATVSDCELRENGTGMESELSRASIFRTRFADNDEGFFSFGGFALFDECIVTGNLQRGLSAFDSRVTIGGGEIRDNLFGLIVQDGASGFLRGELVLGETTGGAPLTVVDNSVVTITRGVTVASNVRIEVGNQSLLDVDDAQIDAGLVLFRWGKAYVEESAVDGDVLLFDFSEAVLDPAVSGAVICDATSDAVCAAGSVGSVSGCSNCSGPPAPAPSVGASQLPGFAPSPGPAEGQGLPLRKRGNATEWAEPAASRSHRGVLHDLPAGGSGSQHD
jgi:hypothetical protein